MSSKRGLVYYDTVGEMQISDYQVYEEKRRLGNFELGEPELPAGMGKGDYHRRRDGFVSHTPSISW